MTDDAPLDEMSLHCEIHRRVQGGHRLPLESCGVYQRAPKYLGMRHGNAARSSEGLPG